MSRRAVQNRQKPNKVARRATLFTTILPVPPLIIEAIGNNRIQAGNFIALQRKIGGLRFNNSIKHRTTLTKAVNKNTLNLQI